ncbi:MAG TPA: hypothetical protein PK263_04390 [bacterium]|nr:hypothetical protein [bacterium]
MNQEINKLKRSIAVALLIIVFAIVILFVFFSRSFASLTVLPSSASLSIDGEKITLTDAGIGKKNVVPGVHHIEAQAEGYVGQNFDLEFKRGFMRNVSIELKKIPEPVSISTKATFLSKGRDFNDSFYLSSDGKTIYHMKAGVGDDGALQVLENRPITNNRLSNIKEIIWSPTKELALFRKNDASITLFDFMKYDFLNQTEIPWGTNIKSVAWSPDNSRIAYVFEPGNGERSIIFSNITNTEMTRVLSLEEKGLDNPILRWSPDSRRLLLINQSVDPTMNNIYVFDSYSKKLTQVTDTGNQIDAQFSPDGNMILYSTFSKSPETPTSSVLSVMNIDGSDKQALGIRAELSKAVWKDNKSILYATFNTETKKESIAGFSVVDKQPDGFVIGDLGKVFIETMMLSSDSKFLLYQTSEGIYALKVN